MASRAGGSRRLSDRSLAEKKFRSMFRGRICLAHGSVALLCTRRLSVVLALAAAVPAVDFDAPARHLDSEHPPHIPPMALARARASLGVASRLGNPSGIRMRGRVRCDYRASTCHTTHVNSMLNRLNAPSNLVSNLLDITSAFPDVSYPGAALQVTGRP